MGIRICREPIVSCDMALSEWVSLFHYWTCSNARMVDDAQPVTLAIPARHQSRRGPFEPARSTSLSHSADKGPA